MPRFAATAAACGPAASRCSSSALGKLFLYDLAFLTAMARAVSFIVTGSVLLLAALLLQRFAPQVKAALGDEPPEAIA